MAVLGNWGFIESRTFPNGAKASVMERGIKGQDVPNGGRVVMSYDGNHDAGFDDVWWYDSVADAKVALAAWNYPDEETPSGHKRDCTLNPEEFTEG